MIELAWRYSPNWVFRGQYFRVNDSSSVTLDRDIEWEDVVFGADSIVGAGAEIEVTRFFFGRTTRQSNRHEFGFGAGLHWLEISAFIAGNAIKNGMDIGFSNEAVSVAGPLPNIGAWYIYSFSPKWAANVRYDWLSANVDIYHGRLVNAAAGLNYAMSENFGAGIGYQYFELDLGIDDEAWRGSAKNRFHGFALFLTGHW